MKINTVFTRMAAQKSTNSLNEVLVTWNVVGLNYFGSVKELSAKEETNLGRILSNATAKILLNNANLPIDEQDRLVDKRSQFVYQVDGKTIDYEKDITTLFVHRLHTGVVV